MTKFEALFSETNGFVYNCKKKKIGDYLLGRTIGEGTFAKVKLAVHVPSGQKVAVKIIRKRRSNRRRGSRIREMVVQEVASHRRLGHPNVVQLYEVMETPDHYYLMMELADGPSLHRTIKERGCLSEFSGRRIFRQIVSAVHHMHCVGVIHRDLKIENILLNRNNNVKVIDLGLSGILDGDAVLSTQCGSPAYTAPEIFAGEPYTSAVDLWSLGVNLFVLLTGTLPFPVDRHSSLSQLHAAILKGTTFPSHLSHSCQDLLQRLLRVAASERMTMSELMSHQWVSQDFAPLLPWEPSSRQATQQLDHHVLRYMSKKLGISEAVVKDAVLRNKVNSITATYHLLSRRPSQGPRGSSKELNPKFVLDCQGSPEERGKLGESGSGNEESDSLSYVQTENDSSEAVEEVPMNSYQNGGPETGKRSQGTEGNGLGVRSGSGGAMLQKEHSNFTVNKHRHPNSGKQRSLEVESETEEIVTVDRKGRITRFKPHSTTVITLPTCAQNQTQSDQFVENDIGTKVHYKETTPRQSYRDCLRKLRSKRVYSPSKGILKTSESFSRPESVLFPESGDATDDLLSSADIFPTDGANLQKRQSSASAKSVRFHLKEEESNRSKTIPTQRMKLNTNNTGEKLLVCRKESFDKSPRQRTSFRDSRTYTWGSFSSQGSKDGVESGKVVRPSTHILNSDYRPTAAPPNTAQGGYRWRRSEDSGESIQSVATFQREPSTLSNSSAKTRKLVLDRYKLTMRNGDGNHSAGRHGDRTLVVNLSVVDCNLPNNPGINPRCLGNIRGRTVTLARHNPHYKVPCLPLATQTNAPRSLTVTPDSLEVTSVQGVDSRSVTPGEGATV